MHLSGSDPRCSLYDDSSRSGNAVPTYVAPSMSRMTLTVSIDEVVVKEGNIAHSEASGRLDSLLPPLVAEGAGESFAYFSLHLSDVE